METIDIVIIVFLLLAIYPFVIYPIVIFILSLMFRKRVKKDPNYQPRISILVPVHNEEKNIEPIINTIKESGYPIEKIQLIFGSDGSTDRTNEIIEKVAKENNFIEYYFFPRKGKNYVLNQLFEKAKNEIVVLLDADIRPSKGSLNKLVSYFSDPNIGGVITNIVITKNIKSSYQAEDGSTQKFLLNIRKWESEIFTTVNNTGPFYAIRKSLISPIPNDKVCDDFYTLLKIVSCGKRFVFAQDVIVFDIRERDSVWREFHRKKRFSAGGISTILAVPKILLHPYLLFLILSHKLLRWFSPLFLIAAILLLFFSSHSILKILLISIIGIFVLLNLLGLLNLKYWKKTTKVYMMPLYILASASGTIAGVVRAILGKQNASWTLDGLEN